MNERIDSALVEKCLKEDKEAFAGLVDRYKEPVYNLVYRMVGNQQDALDLSQDTFFRAFSGLRTFKQDKKFSAWLFKIAVNVCLNFLRRKKKIQIFPLDVERIPGNAYEENLDVKHAIQSALLSIPGRYKAPLVLKYVHGLTYEEIGEATGLPVGTVKMQVHRGKNLLFEKLRETL